MTDIRERLNTRRAALLDQSHEDARLVARENHRSDAYQRASRNILELSSIESTLATMQLADAQREVAISQERATTAQLKANENAESSSAVREELGYWTRKFLTNITIANSAGFAAIVLFMSKSDSPLMDYDAVQKAMQLFLMGMVLGGALPLLAMFGMYASHSASLAYASQRWRWARALNSITTKNVMVSMYAAMATCAMLGGVWLTLKTASSYYENRAAEDSAISSTTDRTRKPSDAPPNEARH